MVAELTLTIAMDDLEDGQIIALLQQHLKEMHKHSPADSVHALDESQLRQPNLQFWAARVGQQLAGCGAICTFDEGVGEIKSMKTADGFLRKGVAKGILTEIIEFAKSNNYLALYLETGTAEVFQPARVLYEAFGFQSCEPFADYRPDPHSCFYYLDLNLWPLVD